MKKTIITLNNENLEVEEFPTLGGSYKTVVLITRNLEKNPKDYSFNELSKMLITDLCEACDKYTEIVNIEEKPLFNAYIDKVNERSTEYAQSHWKTKSKQDEYIFKEETKAIKVYNYRKRTHLGFIDIDPCQGVYNGISKLCIFNEDKMTTEDFQNIYNELYKEDSYWLKAKGYQIIYQANINSYKNCFRPAVKFIFDEETEELVNEKNQELINNINDFYENSSYQGD